MVSEILIVPKNGYHLEEIKRNMPHIEHLLKPRIPQHVCSEIIK